MKTASPLAKTEDHSVNLNVRGSFNDRADQVPDATEYGNRISGSYSGKFLDDKLGFAVGYSRLFQPSVATQFVGLQYSGGAMDTNADGNITRAEAEASSAARFAEIDANKDGGLTPDEIKEAMSGNLCRCGAYSNILDAVEATLPLIHGGPRP